VTCTGMYVAVSRLGQVCATDSVDTQTYWFAGICVLS
jgi:hypothetical protein